MKTTPRPQLTTVQRRIIAGVALGGAVIAVIGFIGSYAAVRRLAQAKGFGTFATLFPIGLDAGICVLLALDLLLTWVRMPFPLLRQAAWLLTAATIAFNAAAAWPDALGVSMHAVIPLLFVVTVEAARHAIGRIADITADRHMEPVRLSRWLLAPARTFLLWRRMKLWELRSYDEVIALEQERLVERLRLRAQYGRMWRRKAPVDTVIAYRMMRYGRALVPAALASTPAVPHLPQPDALGDFDSVAVSALAVAQLDAADECATAQPRPNTEASAQPHPGQGDAQPDALILDLAPMLPVQPHLCAPAPAAAQPNAHPQPRSRAVVQMRTRDDDEQLLERARDLNVKSLRETGKKAPLRLLQNQLGIGQPRAQRIQKQLPDTLAAATAEAQPHAKEA